MRNSLILLMFLIVGCGKQVTISHSKLEAYSQPTPAQQQELVEQGILLRTGIEDVISLGSVSYQVSKHSSHQALQFINSKQVGTQTRVSIKGRVRNKEIVLTSVSEVQ